MRIQLDIEHIHFKKPTNYLLEPKRYLGPFYGCLSHLPFWEELLYFGKWGSKRLKKMKVNEVIENSKTWKTNPYILASENEVMPQCGVIINTYENIIGLKITVGNEACNSYQETLIDDLISCVYNLHTRFKNEMLFGPRMSIMVHGVEYARPRPPHNDRIWESSKLVDFGSKEFHNNHDDGDAEQFKTLESAQVPMGVSKDLMNDLLTIKWIDDLSDDVLIAERLSLHDQWFSENLKLRRKPGFNELGDELEAYENLVNHPELTFYDDFTKIGYKAVVVNPDKTVDNALFEQIRTWILNSATAQGTFLQELNLITPDRESAMFLADKAESIGVKRVLYVGQDDNWWNPNPPGLWIE